MQLFRDGCEHKGCERECQDDWAGHVQSNKLLHQILCQRQEENCRDADVNHERSAACVHGEPSRGCSRKTVSNNVSRLASFARRLTESAMAREQVRPVQTCAKSLTARPAFSKSVNP